MTRWTVDGTHKGELLGMGIPITGREVSLSGVTVDRFANGKIVESLGPVRPDEHDAAAVGGASRGESAQDLTMIGMIRMKRDGACAISFHSNHTNHIIILIIPCVIPSSSKN